MPISPNDKSKHWCFTLNNYDESEREGAFLQCEHVVYYIVGREVAPSTGTAHLQGYVFFDTRRSLCQVRAINARAHWSKCRGTPQQNHDYCSKCSDYSEYGQFPAGRGGRRNDDGLTAGQQAQKDKWDRAKEAALRGEWDDIPSDILIKYGNNLRRLHTQCLFDDRNRDELDWRANEPPNYWYHGAPGTGKSAKARDENPEAFLKSANKWWDGYHGQDTVIIEELELDAGKYLGHFLKIWADRYPFMPEVKGSFLDAIRPLSIIVTSNYSIDEVFSTDSTLAAAIKRRFKSVHFNEAFPYTPIALRGNPLVGVDPAPELPQDTFDAPAPLPELAQCIDTPEWLSAQLYCDENDSPFESD